MRVVVTGASGQLGAAVVEDFRTAHDTVPLTRRDADLTDDAAVAAAIDRVGPEVIVNCAAYTDVDGAEDHPIEALNANAFAVRALARAAERLGATLVHYSTDFVFDGTAVRPYSEEDRPNPRSVYATSKLLGDWFAFDAPRAYVLRVESLFGRAPNGPEPRGSVASILNRLMAGESPKLFADSQRHEHPWLRSPARPSPGARSPRSRLDRHRASRRRGIRGVRLASTWRYGLESPRVPRATARPEKAKRDSRRRDRRQHDVWIHRQDPRNLSGLSRDDPERTAR